MTKSSNTKMNSSMDAGYMAVESVNYSDTGLTENEKQKSISKGGVTTPFPWKLHDMLDDIAEKGDDSIVTWQPHGRAFMVHKPKVFVEDIMHKYFNQTKYASFQRQLNLYGFSRLSHGADKGAYYHTCFVRGQRDLCRNMVRQKIKGTKTRNKSAQNDEPDFYQVGWSCESSPKCVTEAIPQISHIPAQAKEKTSSKPTGTLSQEMKTMSDLNPPYSLVSAMKEQTNTGCSIFVPKPPLLQKSMKQVNDAFGLGGHPLPNAKAGDLLFFEGRPFRYLDQIEEIIPNNTHNGSTPDGLVRKPVSYSETLHDMINSVIGMDGSWKDSNHRNMCSV